MRTGRVGSANLLRNFMSDNNVSLSWWRSIIGQTSKIELGQTLKICSVSCSRVTCAGAVDVLEALNRIR
jgi:hypothetical protein